VHLESIQSYIGVLVYDSNIRLALMAQNVVNNHWGYLRHLHLPRHKKCFAMLGRTSYGPGILH